MNYQFTQSAVLQAVLQNKIPVVTLNDPLFQDIMPIGYVDAGMVVWEQKDDYTGLMSVRGYDGEFGKITREGRNQYKVEPGKYGDQKPMSEEYLTNGREIGTFGDAINILKAQAEDQDHLLSIAISRLLKIGWDLVVNGTYSVPNTEGQILATGKVTTQSFTSVVPWSTVATATPLADLRAIKLKARGYSTMFNKRAKLYVNSVTVNNMLANTNAADLGGRRTINAAGQIQPLSLGQLNEILIEQDLPTIVEYDKGYKTNQTTQVQFIPDGKGVVIGARDTGEPVAEFMMTRNANNLAAGRGATEMYYDFEFKKNPVRGISTLGFNGAPAVYFPSSVVSCNF